MPKLQTPMFRDSKSIETENSGGHGTRTHNPKKGHLNSNQAASQFAYPPGTFVFDLALAAETGYPAQCIHRI